MAEKASGEVQSVERVFELLEIITDADADADADGDVTLSELSASKQLGTIARPQLGTIARPQLGEGA
ncbi:hypothetical protein [Agrococcus sp. Ld7]|uniref:hypothetical protein n=1 Tax=Agrococcus sp. Ld7 TaxID=649148 RepID=UPI00386F91F7